jgi:glycerol-3-phosphate dehydrogenase (NAD(P)+)
VPEGVSNTSCFLALAKKKGVDLPITEQLAAILWEGKSPGQALDQLMTRARKDED